MSDIDRDILEVIRGAQRCAEAVDYDGLQQYWDTQDDQATYIAEEITEPLVGWSAIRGYFDLNTRINQALQVQERNLVVSVLGEGLAHGLWETHWDIKLHALPTPLGGDNRCTGIFRKLGNRWVFVHYCEAPLSPITAMRGFYEQQVTPGFFSTSAE